MNYVGMTGSLTISNDHTVRLFVSKTTTLIESIYVTPAVKYQTKELTFSADFSL